MYPTSGIRPVSAGFRWSFGESVIRFARLGRLMLPGHGSKPRRALIATKGIVRGVMAVPATRWNQEREDDKERVRSQTDIVRVIGDVIALKAKGREYVGLCPFHDDRNPSMTVVPSKQIFKCFVCNAGGDVFSFVMRFYKMEFPEAIEMLAERAGITLTRRSPEVASAPGGVGRNDLFEANRFAVAFFRSLLAHPEHGTSARELIKRRAISPEMVASFGIGASPARSDGLLLTLQSKSLAVAPFVEAGLLKRRDDGSLYDAMRHRLIFPIHDLTGRVIAFGGRRINDEDEPKYLNSPETRLFDKSRTLFALHHASRAIQSARTAIITEGYTDAIACHQGGFPNAVATLGTALTREHAAVLRRMCDRVVLLFDGDEAGRRAADRAAEVFFAEPLDVSIVTLSRFTDAKDPDELLKRPDGADVFARALAGAEGLLEFRFARLRERLAGAGIAALTRGIEEEVGRLVEMGLAGVEPLRQRLIVKRLAGLAGVDEDTIRRIVPAGRGAPGRAARPAQATPGEGELADELERIARGRLSAADHLLGCVLCDPDLHTTLAPDERDLIGPPVYGLALLRQVAQVVFDASDAGRRPDLACVLGEVDDLGVGDAAVALASRVDLETGRDPERLRAHWRACLVRAKQDAALTRTEPKPGTSDAPDNVADRLGKLRAMHDSLGANRRVLPRGD